MILGGFDIATCTGAAIIDGDTVLRCSSFRPDGDTEAEIFTGFRSWFRGLLTYYKVERVAIEQPLVTDIKSGKGGRNPVTFKTYLRLYGLRAIALQSVDGLGLPPVLEVNQMTWRKTFTGNYRASKEETLALAQTMVPDLKSKDAAEALGVARHLQSVLRKQETTETAA